jgi:hypothetical protein
MIGKKSIGSALALLVLVYLASPYFALWQLASALRAGDTRALQALIDWDAVRGGLKQDVADGIVGLPEADDPAPQLASNTQMTSPTRLAANTLPPFGASFMSGIAGTMIDREVTPLHLVRMMRQLMPADPGGAATVLQSVGVLDHAFFDGPTSFVLRIRCAGQDDDDPPLRVRLELGRYGWRVVRAWVPQDLIEMANART